MKNYSVFTVVFEIVCGNFCFRQWVIYSYGTDKEDNSSILERDYILQGILYYLEMLLKKLLATLYITLHLSC